MTTITDEMVEAACRSYEPAIRGEPLHNFKGSTMWDAMRLALESADAARGKPAGAHDILALAADQGTSHE